MPVLKPLIYAFFVVVSVFVLATLPGCGADKDGPIIVALTDSIHTNYLSNYAVYWTLEDSARWKDFVADADSVVEDARKIELYYHDGGKYARQFEGTYFVKVEKSDSGLIARQPLDGWKFNLDTTSARHSIIRLPDGKRAKVIIPASNVVLGGDSVRIGLLRVVDYAFKFNTDTLKQPDYLFLTTWNNRKTPLSLDQENIGPVSGQTVFRIGRKYYVLRKISADYSSLTVEEMMAAREIPLTAEMDVNYKPIQVKTLAGDISRIKHRQGTDLAVYFFHIRGQLVEGVQRLDSIYKTLPEAKRNTLDIALISRNDLPDSLQSWITRHDIRLPVYQATGKTCIRLNCNNSLPSFIDVDEKGRIRQFHGQHRQLEDYLLGLSD